MMLSVMVWTWLWPRGVAGFVGADGTMDNGIPWGHESALPAEKNSVAAARNFVGLHLLEHDLRSLVDDASLVVSEFATNAVMHARTPFVVTLYRLNGCVTLTVSDGSSELPTPTILSVLDEGGRGLWIVDHLSREWGVALREDGVKTAWASFDIPPRLTPPSAGDQAAASVRLRRR